MPFREAITAKLHQMVGDLGAVPRQQQLFTEVPPSQYHEIQLQQGSCLELLPLLPGESIDLVVTSPPYANRYDYTRTYALELVFLGCTGQDVKCLRQSLLSCTVENKSKRDRLEQMYTHLHRQPDFMRIDTIFQNQQALQEVLAILDQYRVAGKLNNDGIVRLVHNYFYEMTCVVFELARLLKPGGIVALVNDNVRYIGEEIPVDIILSDIAATCGLTTRHIWTLERGKGNSSQQMGQHGRYELRKCIYVWEKTNG